MSTQSPLARVEGLGSARSGTAHFWRQRVTAVALIPLSLWFFCAALALVGADRQLVVAFLHQPINAIAMALFVVASLHHSMLGLQVVIEDYVHSEIWKVIFLLLNQLVGWSLGTASLFALVRMAL